MIGGQLPPHRKGVSQKDVLIDDLINHDKAFARRVLEFSKINPSADKNEVDANLNSYINIITNMPLHKSPIKREMGYGLVDSKPGLYNLEIDKLMSKYNNKGFLGVYPINQLSYIHLPSNKHSSYSFILNNIPHNVKMGHFISVMISPGKLEYYNPLGMNPKREFMRLIGSVMRKLKIKLPVQFKINQIRYQSTRSSNCGYFAMRFLQRRYEGEDFKTASGFTRYMTIRKSEKSINKYKDKIKEFGTLQKRSGIADDFIVGMLFELHLRGTNDVTGKE